MKKMSMNEEKPFVPKTALDLQKLKLAKLMEHPEKPVIIPDGPKERKSHNVPEFVRNVMGSSAGAGSGEFHVYRHLRRKEYARQKIIEELSQKEQLDKEFQQKLEENKRKLEEKTAKKRAKRLKKKERRKKLKAVKKVKTEVKSEKSSSDNSEGSDNESETDDVKAEPKSEKNSSNTEGSENEADDVKVEDKSNSSNSCESSVDAKS